MLRLILLFCLFATIFVHGQDPIVQISNGKIKGEVMTTLNNKTFYAFRGIPYAKPPLGELRFQPPQKPHNWEGVLDSDAKDRSCVQAFSSYLPAESEDCLYLHVYTPQITTEKQNVSLPVMYAIHGGAFIFGYPTIDELGPQYLMDYDIVIVSVGYRLGFLGFLSTEDSYCPGNNGLKDQQFGLRWVQENIHNFGGDPNRVTIFGQSAGGASVGYHLLGSNAKGLFHGAIQDSGSPLAVWSFQRNPKRIAYIFANHINSTITEENTSTLELLTFFRTLSVQQVKKACSTLFGENFIEQFYLEIFGFGFVPTIEPVHDGAFLTKPAYQKFLTGDFNLVPTLMGVNSEEGLLLSDDPNLDERIAFYDQNPDYYVLPDMHLTDLDTKKLVGKKIREIYDSSSSSLKNKGLIIKYYSDNLFDRPAVKQAELQSKYTDVYFNEFGYSGELGRNNLTVNIPGTGKVTHGEEMKYLFRAANSKDINSCPEEDSITMRRMLTMWSNFVKYQNPTPGPLQEVSWPKIQSHDEMPFLLINNTLEVNYNYKKKMTDAYQKLYDTYAIPPLDTY